MERMLTAQALSPNDDSVGAGCLVCGAIAGACHCSLRLAQFDQASRGIGLRGLRAAQAGRWSEARAVLEQAAALQSLTPEELVSLGAARLLTGDGQGAAQAWGAVPPSSSAAPLASSWLEALHGGEIRAGLIAFNEALACAAAGDVPGARAALDRAQARLPELVPAGHLRQLLGAPLPPPADGRRPGRRYRIALAAGVLMAFAIAGMLVVRQPQPRASAASSAPAPGTVVEPRVRSDSAATAPARQFIVPSGVDSATLAMQARVGRTAYGLARRAAARHHWPAAEHHLRLAIALGPQAYYADDAWALLVDVYERQARHPEAVSAARALATAFPTSPLLNRHRRALAADSTTRGAQ